MNLRLDQGMTIFYLVTPAGDNQIFMQLFRLMGANQRNENDEKVHKESNDNQMPMMNGNNFNLF